MHSKKIKNLFIVDWKNSKPGDIQSLFEKNQLNDYEWHFFNCSEKVYFHNRILNRYTSYLIAVMNIFKDRKKYDNIIIWQQMIGLILCLFPKFYSRPKIIVTTLLYSPDRIKKKSFKLFLLKNALRRADALVYFSEAMAENVVNVYPNYASKVFSTFLPINDAVDNTILMASNKQSSHSVFTGGFSDRDFETVIRAFSNTSIPVTIVCTKMYHFKNAELITNNFTIKRDVSEIEYFSLVRSASFVVIPLENKYSSCGQILFTFCMKNGIPIIATDCYGTRDYIKNNDNGILVPAKDDRAIFNAFQLLVADSRLKEKLINRSIEISSKMTFENYLKKIESIIQKIK